MAIAVTFLPTTDSSPRVPGTRRRGLYTVTLDSSYPSGGYTVTPGTFGFSTVDTVLVGCTSTSKPVFYTGSKLKIFSAIGTEVSNGASLAGETVVIEVVGL